MGIGLNMDASKIIIRGVCNPDGSEVNLDQYLVQLANDFADDFYSAPPSARTKENLIGYFHNYFHSAMKRLHHSEWELFNIADNSWAFMAKFSYLPLETKKKINEFANILSEEIDR